MGIFVIPQFKMGVLDSVSDFLGTSASGDAISAQTAGVNAGNATEKSMYDTTRADEEPWRAAGVDALGKMQDPSFQKSFSASDFTQDPGYQFRMQQGEQALQRSAAAGGGLMSGATMKALTAYGQGQGAQEYQASYDRFNNDQSSRFGRLATIAGYGQNANSTNAAAGQNYANQVSGNQVGLGNASAAAYVGDANRNAQMLGQVAGGAAAVFCDRRLKTGIKRVDPKDLAELKGAVKAFKFRYKDEKHGLGDFVGPMAQDLAKTKLGKGLVDIDKDGNQTIDVHRTLMLILASWEDT